MKKIVNCEMKKVVVLTGAGISAESGLRTFREADGLWENYAIEDVATISAWHANPSLVLRFYNERRNGVLKAMPNVAHMLLADLQNYYDVKIITQNVDDLHERAGSKNVLHLHGEILKMRSINDELTLYPCHADIQIGDFAKDGTQLRPHIVWFGEDVPKMEEAMALVKKEDIFVVIGTSLQVYPAAGLLHYVPLLIDKYLIDKNTPVAGHLENLHLIQKNATTGMEELFNILVKSQ
jgi:NAD-dependent deacetylase